MKKVFLVLAVAFTMGSVNAYAAPATTTDAPATYAPATDAVDDLLNEFEKCADKLIATYKKAKSGDMAAMAEYVTISEQTAKVNEKIEKMGDSLTDAQLDRCLKITQKLVAALTTDAPATDAVDDLLNEYEKCVDKLIAAYKKAQSGDMAAMAEYATLAEQTAKVEEKIRKVGDSLTDAQLDRYLKITQKLVAAM